MLVVLIVTVAHVTVQHLEVADLDLGARGRRGLRGVDGLRLCQGRAGDRRGAQDGRETDEDLAVHENSFEVR
jgi:hypothetical protein